MCALAWHTLCGGGNLLSHVYYVGALNFDCMVDKRSGQVHSGKTRSYARVHMGVTYALVCYGYTTFTAPGLFVSCRDILPYPQYSYILQ